MSANGLQRRTVTVANPLGLHLRAATAFARASMQVRSVVTVRNGSKQADGRSPSDLILLLAFPGDELLLEVEGEDADEVIEPLANRLGSSGDGL